MRWRNPRWAAASVVAFFGLFYLIPAATRGLWAPDETRYAEISREMLARGHWVVPRLVGLRYFEKPVLGYWFNNIAQWVFGHDNFAVRAASLLATGVSAWLIADLGRRHYRSASIGVATALIYLSMFLVYGVGTMSLLDAMFTVWMTAALVVFHRSLTVTSPRGRVAAYAALGAVCAGGFMTKGFIAMALPVVAVVPYMAYRRRFTELLIYGPVAIAVATLVAAPWAIAVQMKAPDYWSYFFWVQNIQRFGAHDTQHPAPFWYYLPVFALGTLPWLGLLPVALARAWRVRRNEPLTVYLLCWLIFPLLFFSAAKGKLPTYILLCFAPAALLIAGYVTQAVARHDTGWLRINGGVNTAFGGIGIVAMIVLAEPHRHIYGPHDHLALALGFVAFIGWALCGIIQWRCPARVWAVTALCPGALALALAWALPLSLVDGKQPVAFIEQHQPVFSDARCILTNDDGLATSLAWALRTTNIHLLQAQGDGELAFGMRYPDVAKNKRIGPARFPSWLAKARQRGNVVLLLAFHSHKETVARYLTAYPAPSRVIAADDLIIAIYRQTKASR